MVHLLPLRAVIYQWNTAGCYTNVNYNGGVPKCFPHGQSTQYVTDNDLTAEDAGTITCSVKDGSTTYTSDTITLRVTGENIVCFHVV